MVTRPPMGSGLTQGSSAPRNSRPRVVILSLKFTSPQELGELLGFRAVLPHIHAGETDSGLDLLLRDFMDTVLYSRNGPLISAPAAWTHLLLAPACRSQHGRHDLDKEPASGSDFAR